MKGKTLLRWLAASAVADGLGLLVGGRAYAGLWQLLPGPSIYRRSAAWFAALPSPVLRSAGVAEAACGVALLRRLPIPVPELYRTVAPLYDAASPLWRRWLYADADQAVNSALSEQLPSQGRVLDLGCGTGVNLGRLLEMKLPFGSYVGVDQSEEMLSTARTHFGHIGNVSFQRLDLLSDPLPEGPFDLAVSTWVLSDLPDPGLVVGRVMERLSPGGHAVLLFMADYGSWQSRLVRPLLDVISSRPVPENTYLAFRGRVWLERFAGNSVVLMVLRRA